MFQKLTRVMAAFSSSIRFD